MAAASFSPGAQRMGASLRGSKKSMRPQVSQVKMVLAYSLLGSRSVRSFQRWGRTIIWQAAHLWSMAWETPVPLALEMRS